MLGYKELRKSFEEAFLKEGITEFSDIDWIICEVTGKTRSMLPFVAEFSSDELTRIMNAVDKRLKHIPIAYIFEKTNFYGYNFKVNKNVLIPRIDTEILIETAVSEIKQRDNVSVLDIGTGSGAIAIVLNKETGAKVYAVDISDEALAVAKTNALNLNADVEFYQSDIFENVQNLKVDIIVSNPPYIESFVCLGLDREVRDNEPILALDGGEDGLDFYRRIVEESDKHLKTNGCLIFEIGYNQANAVKKLMSEKFKNIKVKKDYGNNDRVVLGELV